ncbi:hypothetical protein [Neisseria sp. Ec49-e6-T10]|uniref:hypothetical protein n=1 Tax=Neisseria sp. Ec49-e6-T10 TaxID=3140744 RepID=UPI003EC0839B
MKNLNIGVKKLFEGIEEVSHKTKYNIDCEGIVIGISDFYENNLRYLEEKIGENEFAELISHESFVKETVLFDVYKSQQGLEVYFCIKDGYIILLSYGEFQPNRYMLFLESIWEN